MSKPLLIVTATVLALEGAVLLLGGFTHDRWFYLCWMLLSVGAGILAPVLNASRAAVPIGRLILVITAFLSGYHAVVQVRLWVG